MPLPAPEPGLVVHYGFVWAGPGRVRAADAGKDRPCLIVDVARTLEPNLAGRAVTRVVYLPISHLGPGPGETAIPIPPRVAAHLELSGPTWWLYTSYANEDDWPFDLARRLGAEERFDDGFVPPRLVEQVAADFAAFVKRGGRALRR